MNNGKTGSKAKVFFIIRRPPLVGASDKILVREEIDPVSLRVSSYSLPGYCFDSDSRGVDCVKVRDFAQNMLGNFSAFELKYIKDKAALEKILGLRLKPSEDLFAGDCYYYEVKIFRPLYFLMHLSLVTGNEFAWVKPGEIFAS